MYPKSRTATRLTGAAAGGDAAVQTHPLARHSRMESRTCCLTLALAAALVATNATAQTVATRQSLSGVVYGSPARPYGRRLSVCLLTQRFAQKCANVDSMGAYRLDSLPAMKREFAVICETVRMFGGWIATDSVEIRSGQSVRRDWQVSMAGCDMRPVRRITREFRGHYVGGFEASDFRPCEKDAWFTPDDSLEKYPFDNRRAWATWSERAGKSVRWPDGAPPRASDANPRYYLHVRGTVVGPGHYGHMSISAFELFVDSVVEIRVPSASDCR